MKIEDNKIVSQKIFNYLFFLRNKAYFASVILPLFWEQRPYLKVENYVYRVKKKIKKKEILFFLILFYLKINFHLNF
jgi:hypothetical protein